MKNIQVFDGANNAVYDIFAATDEEFALIFLNDTDVAFIDEVYQKAVLTSAERSFQRDLEAPHTEASGDGHSRHPVLPVRTQEGLPPHPSR